MRFLCSCCKEEKDKTSFYVSKTHKRGLTSYCKDCTRITQQKNYKRNGARYNTTKKSWRRANPEKAKSYHIKNKYGLSLIEFRDMMSDPCAVCGSVQDLEIDHNHETGEVRGTLCHGCNVAIGFMHEDPKRLVAAAHYLMERNGEE